MELSFKKMTPEHAGSIAAWSYPTPYHVYGYDGRDEELSREELADPRNRFFAALAQEELIGFRSFGADGRVPGGRYEGAYLDTGGGLRPDLVGKGLGAEILLQGLRFGAASFGSESFRVTIAAFNQRALKVCARIGFRERDRFRRSSDGEPFVILTIDSLPSSILPERSLS